MHEKQYMNNKNNFKYILIQIWSYIADKSLIQYFPEKLNTWLARYKNPDLAL